VNGHDASLARNGDRFGLADIFPLACEAGLSDALTTCCQVVTADGAAITDELNAAATAIESWYQQVLRDERREQVDDRSGSDCLRLLWRPLWKWPRDQQPRSKIESLTLQHELIRTHRLVIDAMKLHHGGWKAAKRIQLNVSDGQPLGLCFGESTANVVVRGRPVERYVFHGLRSGCGAIFEETDKVVGAKMFADYCPDCRGGRTHPGRTAKQAVEKRLRAVR
jgi:hypothetical protein